MRFSFIDRFGMSGGVEYGAWVYTCSLTNTSGRMSGGIKPNLELYKMDIKDNKTSR